MTSECNVFCLFGKQLQFSLEQVDAESNSELPGLVIALIVIGIISTLGCIFNIIATFLLKLHRNELGKMVIFLSITDIIFTIIFTIDAQSTIVDIIFSMSWAGSVTWLGCFAHTLYRTVKSNGEFINHVPLKKYIIIFLVVSNFIGVLCAIIALGTTDPKMDMVTYSTLGTLALGAIAYSTFCYISVLKKLLEINREIHLELLVYPLFLIICEFPFIVVQFHVIFTVQLPSAEFRKFSMLLLVSRGFLNSLAYGLSARVRLGFKTLCKSKKDFNPLDSQLLEDQSRPIARLKAPNFNSQDENPQSFSQSPQSFSPGPYSL